MGHIPEQVRRQAERANQLLDQANGNPGEPPADEPPAPAPETQEPQVEQHEEPQAESQQTAPATPPQASTPPTQANENWEHKYKTLQGVLSAESGRWNAERRVLEDRIKALEQAQVQAPPTAPQASQKRVTDQDLETYGPELLDLIGRKAQEIADDIVAQRIQEIKPELDKTREQVSNVSQQVQVTQQDRFYVELAKLVPDWQTVNADQRWLAWLGEPDLLSGVPRQQFLDNASQHLDHKRVATMFDAFKKEAGLNQAPEAPAQAKPVLSPTPRTVGQASAPTHREPDLSVSRVDIAAHYRRSSTDPGYRDSEAHRAMEERIAQAMASGKVS